MASSNAAEFVVALCFVALGCKSRDQRARVAARDAPTHAEVDPDQDDDEDDDRDNYWRAQIAIVGRGAVKTTVEAFDCMRDSRDPPRGECGPKLVLHRRVRLSRYRRARDRDGGVRRHAESLTISV
jgi:hypothetical protein